MAQQPLLDDTTTTCDKEPMEAELVDILKSNKLYDDLYEVLHQNDIDLELIKNDIKQNESDEFCKGYITSYGQKVKFRKLVRLIKTKSEIPKMDDHQLWVFLEVHHLSSLYKILISAKITFVLLMLLTSNDIDKICDNNVSIATKATLKHAINETKKLRYRRSKLKSKTIDQMTIVLIGDSEVGKTSLLKRYVEDKFCPVLHYSFGIDRMETQLRSLSDRPIRITIVDTAGQERYQSVCKSTYRSADVILLCYAVNNKKSLQNIETWRIQIEENAPDDVIVMFVGCKADANKRTKELEQTYVENVIKQRGTWDKYMHNIWVIECSSKTGDNVRNVFLTAVELTLQRKLKNGIIRNNKPLVSLEKARVQTRSKFCC